MKKIAILFSGHIRNIDEIILNLKNNFLDEIGKKYDYDIFIHTWDTNITNDKNLNNDIFYKKNIDIKKILTNNNIFIKKILIENQEDISKKINMKNYLKNNCKNKKIHNNKDFNYVSDLTNKLFWQYYGHSKSLKLIDNIDDYFYIIKTRFDMYYNTFDINILNNNIFFPFSHQMNNTNINQLFFGGKKEYMINILHFFDNFIYYNKNINNNIFGELIDINFNILFRKYIFNILLYKPIFINYNPKIYRNKKKIITLL